MVKVKKKARDEEGGKSENDEKATMYNEVEKEELEEVCWSILKKEKKRKERKGRNTYLGWVMTYLETVACSTFASEAFNA